MRKRERIKEYILYGFKIIMHALIVINYLVAMVIIVSMATGYWYHYKETLVTSY